VRVAKVGNRNTEWTLRLRIPAWSENTRIRANFRGTPDHAVAGSFLEIRRRWKPGDEIVLNFDFHLRTVAGANEAAGKVSIYRGPLLLAYDQACNAFDEEKIPALDLSGLIRGREVPARKSESDLDRQTWVQVDLPAENNTSLRLVDFASAGTLGTHYRSWLAVANPPPPPAFTQHPRDGERVRPGPVQFQWRGLRRKTELSYRLEIA